jgi:hypothetical protein
MNRAAERVPFEIVLEERVAPLSGAAARGREKKEEGDPEPS